jgi:hypothetical protein
MFEIAHRKLNKNSKTLLCVTRSQKDFLGR